MTCCTNRVNLSRNVSCRNSDRWAEVLADQRSRSISLAQPSQQSKWQSSPPPSGEKKSKPNRGLHANNTSGALPNNPPSFWPTETSHKPKNEQATTAVVQESGLLKRQESGALMICYFESQIPRSLKLGIIIKFEEKILVTDVGSSHHPLPRRLLALYPMMRVLLRVFSS